MSNETAETVAPAAESKKTKKAGKKQRKTKVEKKTAPKANGELKLPQFRVLRALLPKTEGGDKPFLVRNDLAKRAGFNVGSGTLQVALAGRSGVPGVVEKELVKKVTIDIDGVKESGFQITARGVKAAEKFLEAHEGKVRKVRDAAISTNKRYKSKGKKKAAK